MYALIVIDKEFGDYFNITIHRDKSSVIDEFYHTFRLNLSKADESHFKKFRHLLFINLPTAYRFQYDKTFAWINCMDLENSFDFELNSILDYGFENRTITSYGEVIYDHNKFIKN